MAQGSNAGGINLTINVEGSVVSDDDLVANITSGIQKITRSSGDQFAVGTSVDYSS